MDTELQYTLKRHKHSPDGPLLQRIDELRVELNLALTTRTEKSVRWASTKFYMHKDKIGSLLAHKLNPRGRTFGVPRVRCPDGAYSQNLH